MLHFKDVCSVYFSVQTLPISVTIVNGLRLSFTHSYTSTHQWVADAMEGAASPIGTN